VSFVVTTPDSVTAAAGNLAGIGSTLEAATAAAASPTTSVATAAADEVSIAISQLFGGYGQEFQTVSAQAAAFHNEFVNLLDGAAAAYLSTDIANAGQNLRNVVNAPVAPGASAAAVPAGAYQQLFANTATNLGSLYTTTAAHPFPLLNQIAANEQGYALQIATRLAGAVQNFPVELANLPVTIQAGAQGLLAFNAAFYLQQFITTQIGFAQTFATSAYNTVTSLAAGLPGFEQGLRLAFHTLLTGNYYGAVQDVAQATANLFVTGFDTSNVTAGVVGTLPNITLNLTANASPLGPLAYMLTAVGVPAQEAQYFTNLIPAGSVPREMSQNFTNVLAALTNPSVSASVSVPLLNPQAVQYNAYFGLPLSLTYAALGPPIATLNAAAGSATAVQQALLAGNGVAAVGAIIDAPAVVANGFLNGTAIVDATVLVPTGLPAPLPGTVSVVLHLPFDGILVPAHPITATVDIPGYAIPGFPVTETVGGTPFSGIVPMLVDYVPEQLAAAIAA
jgi:hypothetical protein